MHGFGDLDWNDHRCEMKRSYICEYYLNGDPVPTPAFPATGGCPTGPDWILYGGVCYKFKLPTGLTGEKYKKSIFSVGWFRNQRMKLIYLETSKIERLSLNREVFRNRFALKTIIFQSFKSHPLFLKRILFRGTYKYLLAYAQGPSWSQS